MKKSILSASIAAMIGGLGMVGAANAAVVAVAAQPTANPVIVAGQTATALAINEAGTGHILLVPYFTTQGTNATLLNITNTDIVNGKLVKVRFRGASNSDDIFDFTVALSPGDVWAAKISQGADKRSRLETSDKSCTLPAFVATQSNSFPTGRLNPALTDEQKANETREGYIEILNMADIPPAGNINQAAAAAGAPVANPLFTAIKHVNGVAPCTTATLDNLKSDVTAGYIVAAGPAAITTTAQGKGLAYASTGLMANWTIIDTVKTATFSGAAVAVRANDAGGAAALANVVFSPQSDDLVPNAADEISALTADPLLRGSARIATAAATGTVGAVASLTPFLAASFYDLPDLSTPYLAATTDPRLQARQLTAALATRSVVNEFLTTTSIGATTDWVFSMPTRRYNVAVNYAFTSPVSTNSRVYTDWSVATAAPAIVFPAAGTNFFTATNTSLVSGRVCVNADTGATGVSQWDREEVTSGSAFVISPATVTRVRFCGETAVLGINNGTNTTTGSLSASLATQNLNFTANEGWLSLGTSGLTAAGLEANGGVVGGVPTGQGLPVLGGAFVKSSSFGAMWPHRYSR